MLFVFWSCITGDWPLRGGGFYFLLRVWWSVSTSWYWRRCWRQRRSSGEQLELQCRVRRDGGSAGWKTLHCILRHGRSRRRPLHFIPLREAQRRIKCTWRRRKRRAFKGLYKNIWLVILGRLSAEKAQFPDNTSSVLETLICMHLDFYSRFSLIIKVIIH